MEYGERPEGRRRWEGGEKEDNKQTKREKKKIHSTSALLHSLVRFITRWSTGRGGRSEGEKEDNK